MYFSVHACEFISIVILVTSLKVYASLKVNTQKDAWFSLNHRHALNCTITGDASTLVQLYWSWKGYKIRNLTGKFNLKEIRINQNTSQLVFLNASYDDAGEFICNAISGVFATNASTIVHIGAIPHLRDCAVWYHCHACSYLPADNYLWLFPFVQNVNEKVRYNVTACCSSSSNTYCQSSSALWTSASFRQYNRTKAGYLLTKVEKRCTYRFKVRTGNKYGDVMKDIWIEFAENCLPVDRRPKVKVALLDTNGFRISWYLPSYDKHSSSEVTVTPLEDQSKVNRIGPLKFQRCNGPEHRCTTTILGTKLSPCKNYSICVNNDLVTTSVNPAIVTLACVQKATKNNFIPALSQVTFLHNQVKKTLEFHWKEDSTLYDQNAFFFKYELRELIDTPSSRKISGRTFKREVAFPEMNWQRGLFVIFKCTVCGCGRETTKGFEVEKTHTPVPKPRKTAAKTSTFPTGVVAAVSCLLVLIFAGLFIFFLYRRHLRRPTLSKEESLEELDDMIIQPQHLYNEPVEVDHHYEQIHNHQNIT